MILIGPGRHDRGAKPLPGVRCLPGLSERPILPRWVAPFSLVTAAAIAPAAGASVVTTGPFAWNGAVSFWLRLVALSLYVAVIFFVLLGAVRRRARDAKRKRRIPGGVCTVTRTAPPPVSTSGPDYRRRARRADPKIDLSVVWWTIPIFYALQGIIYVPLARADAASAARYHTRTGRRVLRSSFASTSRSGSDR